MINIKKIFFVFKIICFIFKISYFVKLCIQLEGRLALLGSLVDEVVATRGEEGFFNNNVLYS